VTVGGKSLGEVVELSIDRLLDFLGSLPVEGEEREEGRAPVPAPGLAAAIAGPILKEVQERLGFLLNVGLDYLTLGRSAETLSGGEAQRIRLATQIGSRLVGVLYILDEPSIGLHQRDNHRLLETLKRLRDLGNTVIVVEHDEDTIRAADFIVDLGPGAGRAGGDVVVQGNLADVEQAADSLTGAYLRGEKQIPVLDRRRRVDPERLLTVRGAREHNLKSIDVTFPLGTFITVTGVSGSGKSTLVTETLYHALARHFYKSRLVPGRHEGIDGLSHLDKVIDVDQSPIGRTPRSNPATYTGVFTPIRELFASLPESQMRGYAPGRFSFNVKGGRCEACQGDGLVKIEMHFLPDVYVSCDVCRGRRYNRETLDVYYKGRNIADVLDMTVNEALEFFHAVPRIRSRLQTLHDVGLGYVHLGQSATTLSGGEAQRVKLATELSKRATGNTFYILDEPTTGLHFEDVRVLLQVLHRLVERGNTVVVIEHNLHVVKTADWIIDLGPEGGDAGGRVVAEGTPEEVAGRSGSYTGEHLAPLLNGRKTGAG
jgi:excinuclease ABC subunit A